MNYIIKNYPSYNARRYSTPWAAPSDSKGKPDFNAKNKGRFTGSNGDGGDLFVADPEENSVWVFGQKDYRGGNTEKEYAVFRNGAFHPITSDELLPALEVLAQTKAQATAQTVAENEEPESSESRKEELLRILFAHVAKLEGEGMADAMKRYGISKEEAEAYGVTWRDNSWWQ